MTDEAVRLYNPNDGLVKRDGGPYLDEVQARQAEELRAYREGREPDFDNLQPHPGVPLVTEEQLIRGAVRYADTSEVSAKSLDGIKELPVYAEVPKDVIDETEIDPEAVENDPALSNAGEGAPEDHVAPKSEAPESAPSTFDFDQSTSIDDGDPVSDEDARL